MKLNKIVSVAATSRLHLGFVIAQFILTPSGLKSASQKSDFNQSKKFHCKTQPSAKRSHSCLEYAPYLIGNTSILIPGAPSFQPATLVDALSLHPGLPTEKRQRKLLPYNPSDTPLARWAKNLHYTPQGAMGCVTCPPKNAGKNKYTWNLYSCTAPFFSFIHVYIYIRIYVYIHIYTVYIYIEKHCFCLKMGGFILGKVSCRFFIVKKKHQRYEFTAHLNHLTVFLIDLKPAGRGHRTF